MCSISPALAQDSASAEAYTVEDAYRIYSLLLPREESYGCEKCMVVIQETTVPQLQGSDAWPAGPEQCLSPGAASQFKDAIADYNRLNQKRWLLQRNFEIEKPYKVVSSDALTALFKEHDWDGFHKRYPDSGGIITFSAVGFNADKTQAIVHSGSSCGNLCGSWSFHLLKKVDGEWKEVPGVTCHTVS